MSVVADTASGLPASARPSRHRWLRKPANAAARGDAFSGEGVRIKANAFALMSFAVGLTQTLKISLIGEAVLAELLLPLLAIAALASREGRAVFGVPLFRRFVLALLVTLAGYVISDLAAGSTPEQYLRGWGRVVMVATNFISLCLIVSRDRQNLWWFLLGMGVGRVAFLRVVMHDPIPMWKFASDYTAGYAEPFTLSVAALGCLLPPRMASLALAAVAVTSIHFDFRIQSAMCMLLAGVMWLRAMRTNPLASAGGRVRLMLLGAVAAGVVYAGMQMTTNDYTEQRRGASDIGRAFGKAFARKAIAESPVIGYGSWSTNADFRRLQLEAMNEVAGKSAERFTVGDSSSAIHAMVFQAWVEGGILGTAFFLLLGWVALRRLPGLIFARPRDPLTPLLVYFVAYAPFNVVMSAFAAPLRVHLGLAACALVCLAIERNRPGRSGGAR